MGEQTLFISYCWKDGNTYADELETQLNSHFKVLRDKSQLIVNDDIFDFMEKIANCDNVIIILTSEYVKSLNCMLEMSYLVSQKDWALKAMVLVIDDSLYSIERKLEVINYWIMRQKKTLDALNSSNSGKKIWEEEKRYIDLICQEIEFFFLGVSRRKNPSQIAIVNEVINKAKKNKADKEALIKKGKDFVLQYIEKNGEMTLQELCQETGSSREYVRRLISNLMEEKVIEKDSKNRTGYSISSNIAKGMNK